MQRSSNPYERFKSDRHRLFALISRDVRIVLVAAIISGYGLASAYPLLRSFVLG